MNRRSFLALLGIGSVAAVGINELAKQPKPWTFTTREINRTGMDLNRIVAHGWAPNRIEVRFTADMLTWEEFKARHMLDTTFMQGEQWPESVLRQMRDASHYWSYPPSRQLRLL